MKNYISAIFMVGVLSGCASMSIEECKTANWTRIGEQDGIKGQGSQLAQHYKACQKASIIPNQQEYEVGLKRGMQYYCAPERIFENALKGQGNYQYCELNQHQVLAPYYEIAHQYYTSQKELDQIERKLEDSKQRLLDPKLSEKDKKIFKEENEHLFKEFLQKRQHFFNIERSLYHFKNKNNLN